MIVSKWGWAGHVNMIVLWMRRDFGPCRAGNPDWGTLWQSGEHFYQKFTQVCKILGYVAIYALLRSFSGWMWGRFWMTGKNLEILTWKSCFFVCISPLNFYMVVTGEFFWWIVCNYMKIMLFCRFDYWTRFTHFGEHFWPAVLDWGTLLHFFQLCPIHNLTEDDFFHYFFQPSPSLQYEQQTPQFLVFSGIEWMQSRCTAVTCLIRE